MRSLPNTMREKFLRIIGLFILCCLWHTSASAQTSWLNTYGAPGCMERGLRGIEPVAAGGFIAAGETWSFGPMLCANSDIYVVRTDNTGNVLWANSYDINGGLETANCIRECANGDFIITGATLMSLTSGNLCCCTPNDLFVMRLDPSGNIKWLRTYGDVQSQGGVSIMEATSGAPPLTAPGDIIVGGWTTSPAASYPTNALLMRLTAGGKILWSQEYDFGAADTIVSIAHSMVPGPPGSVLAAIGSSPTVNSSSCIARFDAGTGLIMGLRLQIWGPMWGENVSIQSIQESRIGPNIGNVIVSGRTFAGEIYVGIINANFDACIPAPVLQQLVLGTGAVGQDNIAYSIQELQTGPPAIRGDLIVTGYTTIPAVARQVYLLHLDFTLAILAFQSYNTGLLPTAGLAIAEVPDANPAVAPGCIIGGVTQDQLPGGELMMMRLNNAWNLNCGTVAIPRPIQNPQLNPMCLAPIRRLTAFQFCTPPVTTDSRFQTAVICVPMMPRGRDEQNDRPSDVSGNDGRPPTISLRNDAAIESTIDQVQR